MSSAATDAPVVGRIEHEVLTAEQADAIANAARFVRSILRHGDHHIRLDLNAIVARKRAAGVQRAAAPMVGAYMPADGWTGGEYATPAMVARDEQTVRDQRADAAYGGYDAGVSW